MTLNRPVECIDVYLSEAEIRVPSRRLRMMLPALSCNTTWLKLNTGRLLHDKYSVVTEL